MPRIELSLSAATLVAVALLLVCAAIAYLYYRNTLPPIPSNRKVLLGSLRGLALFVLCLLILEPLVSIFHSSSEPPVVAVLIDNSESMNLTDNLGDRTQAVSSALSSISSIDLPENGRFRYYLFGQSLHEGGDALPDSIMFNEEATNLSAALNALRKEKEASNIQAAILLTDGLSNRGENPLYEASVFGSPLYTIGIGDSLHPKDLSVTKVIANQIVYENTPAPVDVTIRASGFPNRTIDVVLEGNGRTLDRQQIVAGKGTRDYSATLTYTPEGEGTQRFNVRAALLDGEQTADNNQLGFFARVIKGKLRVLLIAAEPSKDLSLIRNTLEKENSFAVSTFTQRRPSGFYEGDLTRATFDSTDCILLLGVPSETTEPATIRQVLRAVGEEKTPVLFISGRDISLPLFREISSVLPVVMESSSRSEQLAFVQPADDYPKNPLLNPGEKSLDDWQYLPPVFRNSSQLRKRPEAMLLAKPRVGGAVINQPMLVSRSIGGRRSVALLAYGVWRWRLMTAGDPGINDFLASFLSSTVRWLTTRDDDRPLRVETTREFVTEGEPVEFLAQLYDEAARAVDNAIISVAAKDGSREVETLLSPVGNGRYEGLLYGLPAGEYSFTATATEGGQKLGEDRARFSVGELNLEFRDTRMDADLLRRLSYRTNGRFLTLDSVSTIAEDVAGQQSFSERVVEQRTTLELWNWTYSLILALLLFALEWILRKQSGMV